MNECEMEVPDILQQLFFGCWNSTLIVWKKITTGGVSYSPYFQAGAQVRAPSRLEQPV